MRSLILSALAALAFPLTAQAQPISVADLDALFDSEPRVEVNLRGALLRLAAEATRSDEPETAALIDGLRGITVRIYPAPPMERTSIVSRLADVGRRFEAEGWLTLVRVRSLPDDDDGDVWIYVREAGDIFDGLAVLAVDQSDEDAVFVHIDGTIRPSDIGSLTRRFGDIDVDVDIDDDFDTDVDVDVVVDDE